MASRDKEATQLQVFDAKAVRRHRERAARGSRAAEFLFIEGAARLADRLKDVSREFSQALELGSRGGLLARDLRDSGGIASLVASDPAAGFLSGLADPGLVAEAEALPFAPASFDLVVSNLALHWVNDLPGTLLQLRQALKPDGLLLLSLFAGETLNELRLCLLEAESEIENGASPRVAPFADPRELAGLLQRAGFALPVVDTDRIEATYPDALSLMRDLRAMGETSILTARPRRPVPLRFFTRAAEIYAERHAEADGRIPATFQIVWLSGWAPHASQQKPLRPGSATARLADVLAAGGRSGG